jgi:hypothetical protein
MRSANKKGLGNCQGLLGTSNSFALARRVRRGGSRGGDGTIAAAIRRGCDNCGGDSGHTKSDPSRDTGTCTGGGRATRLLLGETIACHDEGDENSTDQFFHLVLRTVL